MRDDIRPLLPTITRHADESLPRECCGYVVETAAGVAYHPCRNIATAKEEAVPHPDDKADAEDSGTLVAFVHSHVRSGAAPSVPDRLGVERTGLPWLIVTASGAVTWNEPCGYQAPLEGRDYLYGVCDCATLARDALEMWYGQVFEVPDVPHGWWNRGEDHFREDLIRQGFVQIERRDVRPGDVLLFQLAAEVPNHIAVMAPDGRLLHHMIDHLSGKTLYGHYWRQRVHSVWRHPACV